jgi:deoxyribodipyrimidine photo-lyase
MVEPWELSPQGADKNFFQVYTPFWKAFASHYTPSPSIPAPTSIQTPSIEFGCSLEDLGLLPSIPWDTEFYKEWTPGENGAHAALTHFLNNGAEEYSEERNRPDRPGSSRLSPHLHWGEISPQNVWSQVTNRHGPGAETYVKELVWREFSYHILYHCPQVITDPLKPRFKNFPWASNPEHLKRWQEGQTGYPIVDAGMRQLWHTGWMHNRVRMIVASFLVKHLLIHWKSGEEWFWDTLVDADIAQNTFNWQWVAGCGMDASPYFRIFNPILQGEKFDPEGTYVKRWVPELKPLSKELIHTPWLSRTRINYPSPLIDHQFGRLRALDALKSIGN